MNCEIEYYNHKNRLASFCQEATLDRLANSANRSQSETTPSIGIKQRLSGLMSQLKVWRAVKAETPVTFDPALQQESNS